MLTNVIGGQNGMGHREHASPRQGGAVNYRLKVGSCEALVQAGGSPFSLG